jgi:hypothetical protein
MGESHFVGSGVVDQTITYSIYTLSVQPTSLNLPYTKLNDARNSIVFQTACARVVNKTDAHDEVFALSHVEVVV